MLRRERRAVAGALQEGTVFAGRYRVVRSIAAGGMGAVYEVIHLGTHRRRALKVMHPHLFQNDEMRERFVREARITAPIESEYIVDVSDAGIDERTRMPFLVMELLQGEELGERLKRVGRFSSSEVVTYLTQAAMALDRTHRMPPRRIPQRTLCRPSASVQCHRSSAPCALRWGGSGHSGRHIPEASRTKAMARTR